MPAEHASQPRHKRPRVDTAATYLYGAVDTVPTTRRRVATVRYPAPSQPRPLFEATEGISVLAEAACLANSSPHPLPSKPQALKPPSPTYSGLPVEMLTTPSEPKSASASNQLMTARSSARTTDQGTSILPLSPPCRSFSSTMPWDGEEAAVDGCAFCNGPLPDGHPNTPGGPVALRCTHSVCHICFNVLQSPSGEEEDKAEDPATECTLVAPQLMHRQKLTIRCPLCVRHRPTVLRPGASPAAADAHTAEKRPTSPSLVEALH